MTAKTRCIQRSYNLVAYPPIPKSLKLESERMEHVLAGLQFQSPDLDGRRPESA